MPPRKKPGKDRYQSGFCAAGSHEGTKPVSYSGRPMKTCDFWQTCPCKCHEDITKMYELTDMDREPPEQSAEYQAFIREQRHQFVMPSFYDSAILDGLSSVDGTDTPPGDEGPATDPARPVTGTPAPPSEPTFGPTPTGRRARGQLEYDVLKVCADYADNHYEWDICTPKMVAEQIGKMNATEPPSTGAINAVWDRWEKLGFAKQDKKPSRFVGFESAYTAQSLDMLKARVKRDKKRGQAEIKRGSLRPRGR